MQHTALPTYARLPINRCNLPAVILGSLTYQSHPTTLMIDGVLELHHDLFAMLDPLLNPLVRRECFTSYMAAHFRLNDLEDAGLTDNANRSRAKANYLRAIRGWSFDSDSRDGAVLKGWAESRFGLLPRYHKKPLHSVDSEAFARYMHERTTGLYNTNSLEAQLDLVYTYCQYELARRDPKRTHIHLYRGVNRLAEHEVLEQREGEMIVLLNNLNSFTGTRERADEFGDVVLETDVPPPKIFYSSELLGGLDGEDEYIVLGGLYRVTVANCTTARSCL